MTLLTTEIHQTPAGEVVVFALPGHTPETQAVACDRELVPVDGRWALKARDLSAPAL